MVLPRAMQCRLGGLELGGSEAGTRPLPFFFARSRPFQLGQAPPSQSVLLAAPKWKGMRGEGGPGVGIFETC